MLREFRVVEDTGDFELGQEITVEVFDGVQKVKVTGIRPRVAASRASMKRYKLRRW